MPAKDEKGERSINCPKSFMDVKHNKMGCCKVQETFLFQVNNTVDLANGANQTVNDLHIHTTIPEVYAEYR